ncbi:MAG: cation:proton antiporter [Deltaproteobacteria bacterium]|nr:cation:proton antiporter [Deltaproteobacteria bacterium]
MHGIPLLDEIAVVAGLGVVVTLVLTRLRLPTVAGLLLAGALCGPHGLGLAKSVEALNVLAEIGVVLLLFTIGLEFSLARLKHIFRQVALGGLLQVGLTMLATIGIALAAGESGGRAVFFGFIVALSSTAIVLRALGERRELDAPHGRFIVGTLIFQDLCVVPMVLAIPMLAGGSSAGHAMADIGIALGKAAIVVIVVLLFARLVVPRVLRMVDAAKSREIFLLAVLSLCVGTAWLTSLTGLSLALGAFLGGMVVADTEYGHRAMGDILPLRDLFVSIFFISLGMLFQPAVVVEQPLIVTLFVIGFVVGKGLLATLAAMVMRFPRRVAWLAGVGLAQFGEFGFVLTTLAIQVKLVTAQEMAPLLDAGIISMFLTPLVIRIAPHISAGERLLAPLEKVIGVKSIDEADAEGGAKEGVLKDHVVIVGFGVAGRMAARALRRAGRTYVVLELDAERVRAARAEGEPVYYGDATSTEALGHAHIDRASALVLLMNDPSAAQRVVDSMRRLAPRVPVLMRTKYVADGAMLRAMGVTEVVAEELEGGVAVAGKLLAWLDVPPHDVTRHLAAVRKDGG